MNLTHKILFGVVATSAWLAAGSVTIPHSFTADTKAKASEVNANFSAVKTAVDGNAADIATNRSNISTNAGKISDNTHAIATNEGNITTNANDIATNKAGITTNISNIQNNTDDITEIVNERISRISATGGLTGGGDSGDLTIRRASGSVAISQAAFHSSTDPSKCFMQITPWYAYFNSATTDDDCEAVAQVTLPDGATLEKLTCAVRDSDDAAHPAVYLVRHEPGTNAANYLLHVATTANDSSYQTIYDDAVSIGYETVDNSRYTYHLSYDPPDHTSTAGLNQRLAGCIIDYSY